MLGSAGPPVSGRVPSIVSLRRVSRCPAVRSCYSVVDAAGRSPHSGRSPHVDDPKARRFEPTADLGATIHRMAFILPFGRPRLSRPRSKSTAKKGDIPLAAPRRMRLVRRHCARVVRRVVLQVPARSGPVVPGSRLAVSAERVHGPSEIVDPEGSGGATTSGPVSPSITSSSTSSMSAPTRRKAPSPP